MSQITKVLTSGGPIPPIIPTSFVTQDGTAVPAANILIVNGEFSTENNDNGIITKGGVVGTGTANELDVVLTNRTQDLLTTANATPTAITTFPLGATPGVYTFDINICAFDVTDSLGIGYSIFGTVRTDGATATLVGTPDKIVNEESGVVAAADANLTVSANNAVIQVTGIAATTINWNCVSTYLFVS